MTPEQHNKYLGISHLVHGGLFLLLILFMMTMMSVLFWTLPPGPDGGPPPVFFGLMWVFFGGFYGLMLAPQLVAGYALLKRKRWARTAAIIGAVTAAMSFPIGTAVCVYTFWFLFSEPGKYLYDQAQLGPPLPPASFPQREIQHYSPPTPPDWR